MEASDRSADFVPAGLATLGIDADELELQIITGVHEVFRAPIGELVALDLRDAEPEPSADYSRAPR